MIRATLSLLMTLVVVLVCSTTLFATEPKGADIELSTSVVDLGEIAQDDGKQMVRITFTNTGNVPLVVTEVRTSCSCMTVDYKREKVLPAERGTLTITLNPAKAPKGQYLRVMQIFSTATSGVKRVTVKAQIV
ncbi:MAG: DUF1573 domain-containing protein [Alistipes sp.]|nr:DUF1573 domain-containing protein [Alistipes sp.]